MQFEADHTPNSSQARHSRPRWLFLTALLLLGILLLGGYFRFVGLNWDDFSSMHPDERFLTRNLLPIVGGPLEFTPDKDTAPPQVVLVSMASPVTERWNIEGTPSYQIGAINNSFAVDVAKGWLGDNRVTLYDKPEDGLRDLIEAKIAALVVDESAATLLGASSRILMTFSSEEAQQLRCLARNPATNGAGGYFDTDCSPLNPHNAGAGFYAYGTLPLFIAHFADELVQQQTLLGSEIFNYQGGVLVWRFFSALFDCGTILLVFLLGARMHHRWVGLLAALLYAAAPLAIQKAHFGTVNAVTGFFVVLALWAAVHVQDKGRYGFYALFGVALGAALSGRINTLPLAGVIVLAAIFKSLPVWDSRVPWSIRQRLVTHHILGLFLAGAATFLTFRLCNPYAFRGPGFFGILPDHRFLGDLSSATFGVSGNSDGPPNWQWLARSSYIFPLKDMLLWGLGIASGSMAWFGCLWSGYRLLRGRPHATRNMLVFAWVAVYFLYMGRQWVMTMRYYLPMYGALAVLAAWAVWELYRQARLRGHDLPMTRAFLVGFALILGAVPAYDLINTGALTETGAVSGAVATFLVLAAWLPGMPRYRAAALGVFVAVFSVVWGMMFTNIYRHQLTRVQASRYVWEQIPGDFAMQVEGAPDDTPLINIAIPNARPESSQNPGNLATASTRLTAKAPFFTVFTAPADGVIRSVYAPHLGDADDDRDGETIYISIAGENDTTPLGIATLTADFRRDKHILGGDHTIPLDVPVEVKAGQRYTFKAEALSGTIITGGSVLVTEGDWDDRLTIIKICQLPEGKTLKDDLPSGAVGYNECNGIESWYALVNSFDVALSYPVDEVTKRDSLLSGLNVGDYIAITSNRFYDTEARNPLRFPLTTRYYEALFSGELGYDLVKVFQESYELGDLGVSDQHLPVFTSPQWFNELEADEAFHVYDHPAVFIFKKNAAYDPQRAEFILNSVELAKVNEIVIDLQALGSQMIGVVYWNSLQTDDAPTGLLLPADMKAIQRAGGTWSERFDSGSLINTNQPVGVIVWWLAIVGFGLIAFPILFVALPGLTDRGYGFAKIMGLFLVAWLAWLASSARVPLWSQSGVLLCLLIVAAFSASLAWRRRSELQTFVRERWRLLLTIETLTLILFIAFLGVRLTNPDLWHPAKGGEKPMDFTFFNGVLRSTLFPAYDPWYADGYINYYYVGYVVVGSPVLLLKLVPAFAYNLIIPTLFALAGIGAFSATYNIVSVWRERPLVAFYGEDAAPRPLGNPYVAGIAALLLCVVLGNLDTIRVFGNGLATLGGYQMPTGMENWYTQQFMRNTGGTPTPELQLEFKARAENASIFDLASYELEHFFTLTGSLISGAGRALGGATLPIGSDRWYWGPSRVLAETPGVEGNAINELPYFTFLYGDLHAHMISLPILLFIIAFVFNEVALAGRDARPGWIGFLALALGGITVGMTRAINTWDLPTFLALSLAGLTFAWWLRWGRISRWSLLHLLYYVGGFLMFVIAAAQPYAYWYAAVYGAMQPWTGGKTPVWAYFDIHGLFLFLTISLLVWETARWLRSIKVKALRGQVNWVLVAGVVTSLVLLSALVTGLTGYQVALIVLPLILWIVPLFFRRGQSRPMQFVLVLAGLALLLTLVVEIVVLGGDIGRQNTVFKFYMHVWILLSIVGGAACAWLIQASDYWSNKLRVLWFVPGMLLFMVATMYPIMATRARSLERMIPDLPLTLNGMDYMAQAQHQLMDYPEEISLKNDYAIIRWLQENVQGSPVIMEGRSLASEYRWNSRITIYTGLPSVLGWNFHQRQQRTFDPLPRLVEQREYNIKYFYSAANITEAVRILRHYDVRYVIVSDMERAMNSAQALAKFDTMVETGLLSIAFQQDTGVVYEVDQAALDEFAFQEQNEG